jgi:hypothetical protein
VPATTKSAAAVVNVTSDGRAYLEDGTFLGTVFKGEYTVNHNAAGHSGRVLRFSLDHAEWAALLPNKTMNAVEQGGFSHRADFRGGDWKQSRRKNSRKAALAFLLAVHGGEDAGRAEYFYWQTR